MAGNRNSGRRPQPTALKVLRGNPSKTRLNEQEPKPPAGAVTPPDGVSPQALDVWATLGPVAIAMGTLTTADTVAFATLCELEATRRLASAEKGREGFTPFLITTTTDAAGNEHPNVKEHPAIRLERHTATAVRPYYERFGLEPAGRSRLSVPKAQESVSKWTGVIG